MISFASEVCENFHFFMSGDGSTTAETTDAQIDRVIVVLSHQVEPDRGDASQRRDIHDALVPFARIAIRMQHLVGGEVDNNALDLPHLMQVSTASSSVISLSFLCSLPNLEVLDLSHPSLNSVVRIDGNLCCDCPKLRKVVATGLFNVVDIAGSVLCGVSLRAIMDGNNNGNSCGASDSVPRLWDEDGDDSCNDDVLLEGMTGLREIGGDMLCQLKVPHGCLPQYSISYSLGLPTIASLPSLRTIHGSLLCHVYLEGFCNLSQLDRFWVCGGYSGHGDPVFWALEVISGDFFCNNVVSDSFPTERQGLSLTFHLPALRTIQKSFLSSCSLPGDVSLLSFQMPSLHHIGGNFCVQMSLPLPSVVVGNGSDEKELISDACGGGIDSSDIPPAARDRCCWLSFKGLPKLELIGGSFLSLCQGIPTSLSFEGLRSLKKISSSFLEKVVVCSTPWNCPATSRCVLMISFEGLSALRVLGKFLVSCRLHSPHAQQRVSISTTGLEALATVKGDIFCCNTFHVEDVCFGGLTSLVEVGGSILERMKITGEIRFGGANRLRSIGGNFLLANSSLPDFVSFEGLGSLDVIEGGFVRGTKTSPKTSISFTGLRSLRRVGCLLISCTFESVDLDGLTALDEVKGRFFEDCLVIRRVLFRGMSSLRVVPNFPLRCTFGGDAPKQQNSVQRSSVTFPPKEIMHADPTSAAFPSALPPTPLQGEPRHSFVCVIDGFTNSSAALNKLSFAGCNLPTLDFVVDVEL